MSDPLLIYGATATGPAPGEAGDGRRHAPALGGRDAARLADLARALGLEHRTAALTDVPALRAALRDIRVVLHAAGPFSATAEPMLDACLAAGVHYLDLTAEIRVIEALARRDAEARRRSIMVMPAVGFDVVPSDCLAAHVARRLPGARALAFGVTGFRFISRGSAKTLLEAIDYGVVRRDGAITGVPLGSLQRQFDYGDGLRPSHNISWGDVATAYYTTGIPTIETYHETTPLLRSILFGCRAFGWALRGAPWQALLKAQADLLPADPGAGVEQAGPMVIVAEARADDAHRATARLCTPEAYRFTAVTGAAIAQRALRGDVEVGFQTPARVFGADFVLSFAGVSREDLD
ncbi:MAG: saccharopine dehydrogenase NADP-binding domain-containing protein [Candidatus Binatia bacterium]